MALEVLKELGLTESEISVYLALLEIGQSTTGSIIGKAKISSSKIYEILEKLSRKGLVSYVLKGSIKYFEATPPSRILDLLKNKEEELEKQRKEIEKIIPELTKKKEFSKIKENAAIYRGTNGVQNVFNESLDLMKKGETYYVMSIPKRSEKINYFFVKWNQVRAKKGVKAKLMFNANAKFEIQAIPKNNPLSEIKYMPEGIIAPTAVNLFNDRVVIFPEIVGEEPLLIVIDNKEVAESFKVQFDLLWGKTVLTFNGVEGPRYVLKDIINSKYDENLAFGLSEDKLNKYAQKELAELVKLQNEGKINPARLIFTGKVVKKELSEVSKFRTLPDKFSSPIHYEIYGDKVAMINWEDPITTIITENKAMADSFRIHFNNLWKIAKA